MAYVVRKACRIKGKEFDLPFIVAVATKESAKRQGKATQLIEKILADLHNKDEVFVALHSAVTHDFYSRFGFVTASHMLEKSVKFDPQLTVKAELQKTIDYQRISKINKKFFDNFDNHFVYDKVTMTRLFAEYSAEDIPLYILTKNGEDRGYCFADKPNKRLEHTIGDYDILDGIKEWDSYKYLIPSNQTAQEHCKLKIINPTKALLDFGLKDISELTQSKNFFVDKY